MKLKELFTKVGRFLPYAGFYIGLSNYFMASEAKNLERANSTLQEILDSIFGSGSSSSNFIDTSGLLNS
jgi:hypothetical protein